MTIKHAVIIAIASPNHVSGLTKSRPHAMLPTLGKPLIIRVLNQLLEHNITKFVVIVGINEGSVASYLKSNWVPNVEIEFVLKSDYENLAITLAQISRKLAEPFFIANYNTIMQPQFIATALKLYSNEPEKLILAGTRSTLSHSAHDSFAIIDDDNQIMSFTSEPPTSETNHLLIANMAICGHQFVEFLMSASTATKTGLLLQNMNDIFKIYIHQSQAIKIGQTAWIMQVNNDADLMLLNYQLLEEGRDAHILSELPSSVRVNYPVRIDPGVSIGQYAEIGPYVFIESGVSIGLGAQIKNSLILDKASISPNAVIENVIITPNRIIPNSTD